jgi:hypothetical protein
MKQDLDSLKKEIQNSVERSGFALFHGCSRVLDDIHMVHWDVDRHPELEPFLAAARQVGVKMLVLHHREFTESNVDDAIERLDDCEMSMEDRHDLERRLEALRKYDGSTCAIELSFDYQDRVYMFDVRTDWYMDFIDALEEIEPYFDDEDEEDDDDTIGGYYSRN